MDNEQIIGMLRNKVISEYIGSGDIKDVIENAMRPERGRTRKKALQDLRDKDPQLAAEVEKRSRLIILPFLPSDLVHSQEIAYNDPQMETFVEYVKDLYGLCHQQFSEGVKRKTSSFPGNLFTAVIQYLLPQEKITPTIKKYFEHKIDLPGEKYGRLEERVLRQLGNS